MAQQKKTNTTSSGKKTNTNSRKKGSTSRNSASKSTNTRQKASQELLEQMEREDALHREILLWTVLAVSILLMISSFGFGGVIGHGVSGFIFGLFGLLAYVFPLLLAGGTFFMVSNRNNAIAKIKIAAVFLLTLFLCLFFELVHNGSFINGPAKSYVTGSSLHIGGGFFGGLLALGLVKGLGLIGAYVVDIIVLIVSCVLISEKSAFKGLQRSSAQMQAKAIEHRKETALKRKIQEEKRKTAQEQRLAMLEEQKTQAIQDANSAREARKEASRQAMRNSAYISDDDGSSMRMGRKVEGINFQASVGSSPMSVTEDESDELQEVKINIHDQKAGPEVGRISLSSEEVSEDEYINGKKPFTISGATEDQIQPATAPIRIHAEGLEEEEDSFHANMPSDIPKHLSPLDLSPVIEDDFEPEIEIESFEDPDVSIPEVKEEPFSPVDHFNDDPFAEEEDELTRRLAMDLARDEANAEKEEPTTVDDLYSDYDEEDGFEDMDPADALHAASAPLAQASNNTVANNNSTAATPSRVSVAPTRPSAQTEDDKAELEEINVPEVKAVPSKPYEYPTIDLLAPVKPQTNGNTREYLMETANKLETVLRNFGVNVTVTDVSCGPAVTRYEIQPEVGVKVSKIVNLADDLKLNLAAPDIRIEAPIPGKAAVGIEVPNKETTMVPFRDLMESPEFKTHSSGIAFAAGKDIGGKVVISDIAKMPHLLIAGATGSGKSVCINTVIMSILFKADPKDVKFIMIDPKVVELSVYNGIPHLLIPVVTDPKKAAGALHWAVREMTDRYNKFAEIGVRDMKGYNARIHDGKMTKTINGQTIEVDTPKMYQLVVIVDELADLMMVASSEVEEAICRLAQLARAAGIHLIIATQRPSVNVITGLIKANMPSRIAFSVTSGIDSRTILDMVGAEKLLGKGDMLYYPQGFTKPLRVQGAFVTDDDVMSVVDFLKTHNEVDSSQEELIQSQMKESEGAIAIDGNGTGAQDDDRDQFFEDAGRLIIQKEKGSIGMLQRDFKIGFNRAARIMDQLEEAGVVGPEEGTKPRRVLMSMTQFEELVNL